ncbi:MAG TPA: methyltransferase domain-containing protein, partial [Polyangiaceae bacterium]|nr:methyltransferase domain-containing protein [Polyangiaceae bacterium]
MLALSGQAIYQHPVPSDAIVDPPYTVDLSWLSCGECSHGWQPRFDEQLLARIYRSHYYTPAPGGFALQFRNDFLAALEHNGVVGHRRALLEIGASDGDVLSELARRTGALHAYAFEPNHENAAIARKRGLDVRESFFGVQALAEQNLEPADLIYARHVIEHIFAFGDFFTALARAAAPGADLILETPSLDFHAREGSLGPFHVEHVHVFSLRSLVRLAVRHGWGLTWSTVSADGNLIAAFGKSARNADVPAPALDHLQRSVNARTQQWRERVAGKRLLFWGAGSTGVALANILGREPDLWTDGNPNKVGKKFIGLQSRIIAPEEALRLAREW